MFYPFKVSDPLSGLQYRLNDTRLAELSLAPLPKVWAPHPIIKAAPDPVWAESLANAPAETASAFYLRGARAGTLLVCWLYGSSWVTRCRRGWRRSGTFLPCRSDNFLILCRW